MNIKHLLKNEEELMNVITHGAGLLLGLGFLPILIWEAYLSDKQFAVPGVIVFGISLILVFAMSTLYHAQKDPFWKDFFHRMDYVAIFTMIAGTYTPFILLFFKPPQMIFYLALIWSLAIIGSIFKISFPNRFNRLTTYLYLLMGWMIVIIGQPIFQELSWFSIIWLFAGGLGYSFGTIFYLWEKLKFSHAIWHVFVLIGSASHFIAIWLSLY